MALKLASMLPSTLTTVSHQRGSADDAEGADVGAVDVPDDQVAGVLLERQAREAAAAPAVLDARPLRTANISASSGTSESSDVYASAEARIRH